MTSAQCRAIRIGVLVHRQTNVDGLTYPQWAHVRLRALPAYRRQSAQARRSGAVTLHRILFAARGVWQALDWAVVGGHYCPSLGEHVALVEWHGAGEPRVPGGGA